MTSTTIPMPDSAEVQLTFGIKLQFFMVNTYTTISPGKWPTHDHLRAYLRENGILAVTEEETSDEGRIAARHWRVGQGMHCLSREQLATLPSSIGSMSQTAELISPKYVCAAGSGNGSGGSPQWEVDVQRVLGLLASFERAYDCRVVTNAETRFHVHVGTADGAGVLSLAACKNLLHLAAAFERQIDRLHAAARIAAVRPLNGRWTPPSVFLRGGRMAQAPESRFFRHVAIEAPVRVSGVGLLLRAVREEGLEIRGDASAYNFDQMFADPGRRRPESSLLRTVEFQQHMGTLDGADVFAWIRTVGRMVRWAVMASDAAVKAMILDVAPRTPQDETGTDAFLEFVGVDADTRRFYRRVVSPTAMYAGSCREQRIMNENDERFRAFVKKLEDERYEGRNFAAVDAAIAEKERQGCYGRDEGMSADDAVREQLRASFRSEDEASRAAASRGADVSDEMVLRILRRRFGLPDLQVDAEV